MHLLTMNSDRFLAKHSRLTSQLRLEMLKMLGLPISFTEVTAAVANDTVRVQVFNDLLKLAMAYCEVDMVVFWAAFKGDTSSDHSALFHGNGTVSIVTIVNNDTVSIYCMYCYCC